VTLTFGLDADMTFLPMLCSNNSLVSTSGDSRLLTLTCTSSLALTHFMILTLPLCGVDLVAYVQQASDDGVDWEVADPARRQGERRPTYRTRHRPPTRPRLLLCSQVGLEAGGTERVDGAWQNAWVGEDVAADGTLDQLSIDELQ